MNAPYLPLLRNLSTAVINLIGESHRSHLRGRFDALSQDSFLQFLSGYLSHLVT